MFRIIMILKLADRLTDLPTIKLFQINILGYLERQFGKMKLDRDIQDYFDKINTGKKLIRFNDIITVLNDIYIRFNEEFIKTNFINTFEGLPETSDVLNNKSAITKIYEFEKIYRKNYLPIYNKVNEYLQKILK